MDGTRQLYQGGWVQQGWGGVMRFSRPSKAQCQRRSAGGGGGRPGKRGGGWMARDSCIREGGYSRGGGAWGWFSTSFGVTAPAS